jgi:hypothetical protein
MPSLFIHYIFFKILIWQYLSRNCGQHYQSASLNCTLYIILVEQNTVAHLWHAQIYVEGWLLLLVIMDVICHLCTIAYKSNLTIMGNNTYSLELNSEYVCWYFPWPLMHDHQDLQLWLPLRSFQVNITSEGRNIIHCTMWKPTFVCEVTLKQNINTRTIHHK